ncbi:MAG: hypothetical protein ABSF45_15235 [Terriglobia bacterium]|jgi:hypothetical protein
MTTPFKFPSILRVSVCSSLLLLLPGHLLAQTAPVPVRDPNAVAIANKALQALTGGTTLTDITLQATATYTAGSDLEMGAATLAALGNQQSRVALGLTNGQRTEIRSGPAGDWIGADGVEHAMELHNCWPDADWFYPGLSLGALNSDPGLGLAYVGPVTKNGVAVVDLRLFRAVPSASGGVNTTILKLSAEDIYLDPTSLLPLFLDFNVHPDADFTCSIPVEIVFAQYRTMSGVAVPTRIQKFLNGGLLLDLTVGSAAINSGLPASEFAVTTIAGGAQ